MKNSEDLIDLKLVVLNLLRKWKTILFIGLLFSFISGIYSVFFIKPVYVSQAQLIPTKGSGDGQLAAAAALIGAKSAGNDAQLFQHLLTSRKVAKEFLRSNVFDSVKNTNSTFMTLMHVDTTRIGAFDDAIDAVTKSVDVDEDTRGGEKVVTLSFSANSPWLAKVGGDYLIRAAFNSYDEIKTLRYATGMSRLNNALDETYREWQLTAKHLMEFKDKNRSITLPDQELALSKLEMEKLAKEQKYLLARREFEEINLNLLKSSAPMIVIDSMEFPKKKSKPNRRLYVVGGLFFGLFASSFLFAIRYGDTKV